MENNSQMNENNHVEQPQQDNRLFSRVLNRLKNILNTVLGAADKLCEKVLHLVNLSIGRDLLVSIERIKAKLDQHRENTVTYLKNKKKFATEKAQEFGQRQKASGLAFLNECKQAFAVLRQDKKAGVDQFKQIFGTRKRTIRRAANWILPVVSVVGCMAVLSIGLGLNFVLKVNYNGEFVGYIDHEQVYDSAQSIVSSRLAEVDTASTIKTPEFTLAIAAESQLENSDSLANKMISASGDEITEAYGLYVDGQFYGAVEDAEEFTTALNQRIEAAKQQYPNAEVSFVGNAGFVEGLYPNQSVVSHDEMQQIVNSETQSQITYTVQSGDTFSGISSSHNLTQSELLAMNPGVTPEQLHIGQQLILQNSSPLIQLKVVYTVEYEESIPYETETSYSASYYVGQTIVRRNGEEGAKTVTAQVTLIDGVEQSRTVVSEVVTKSPVSEVVTKGSKSVSSSGGGNYTGSVGNLGSGTFRWPVGGSGGYISCYLYGYSGHTGIDIAGIPKGTPVYAADSGTVVTVKYLTTGYGYHVIINHGNGYTTYYAHMSSINVSVGQVVSRGQQVGAVGRTGNATGNHLHFEVRYNGSVRNPLDYL